MKYTISNLNRNINYVYTHVCVDVCVWGYGAKFHSWVLVTYHPKQRRLLYLVSDSQKSYDLTTILL